MPCWYLCKARQQCLLWYAASLCLSATIFVLGQSTVYSRNRTFSMGYPNFMRSYGGLLEPRGRNSHCQNLRLMLKILFAGCIALSPVISTQFTLEMSVAAPNRKKKSLKTSILEFEVIQGHRCWHPRKGRQRFLLMTPNKSVSICNHSQS